MKFWLSVIIRLIAIIVFLILIALTSRMHMFLAIPTIVLSYFGYAFLVVWIDSWDNWF